MAFWEWIDTADAEWIDTADAEWIDRDAVTVTESINSSLYLGLSLAV